MRALRFRLSRMLRRNQVDSEIDDELQFHLDALTEENRARGMTEEAARQTATSAIGNLTRTKEEYREKMTFPLIESILRDAWYGLRGLRRAPAFTATAIIVLGLGIGLNVGVVSIVRALCYRPLPLPGAERLAGITRGHRVLPYRLFEALREHGKEQIDVAAYDPYATVQVGSTRQSSGGKARAALVSDNFFRVLNVQALWGSTFHPEAAGTPASAVLSQRVAERYFGAGSNAVGETIRLNQQLFTVTGVMPAGFQGPDLMLPELWVRLSDERLLRPGYDIRKDADNRRLILVGRLAPGVTRNQAREELSAIAARVPERKQENEGVFPIELRPAVLFPLNQEMLPFLVLLIAPTGMVLLIACANLANLLLARSSRRGKEMATRLALGAGRGRLVRQLMTESMLLALFGGLAGTLAAAQLLQSAGRFLGAQAEGMGLVLPAPRMDAGVLGFMLGLSMLAALTCGISPALKATRLDLASAVRQESGGTRGSRLRNVLMIAQVAVCTVLLCAAGLMLRSFQRSLATDPGFRTERVVAAHYDLASAGYSPDQAAAFQQRIRLRLQSSGKVRAVALASAPPLSDRPLISIHVSDADKSDRRISSPFNRVSAEFFPLFGIRITAGRAFTPEEIAAGTPVAVVSQATAQRLWPGRPALGQRFRIQDNGPQPWHEVVGVAADTRSVWLSRVDENYVYLPFDPKGRDANALLVELVSDTPTARTELSDAFRAIDAELPVSLEPMTDVLGRWRLLPLAGSAAATTLGALALLLAGVGLYGVMAYLVSQRSREFGIRVALGADKRAIVGIVYRRGFGTVGLGLVMGLSGGALLARLLMGSFYGLSPYDPPAFLFVISFVGAAALASMYGPARRAASVDPAAYLREE
ncbi:MAG: ADOP family duplicated permease [Paludibaculum sp.]